MSQHRQSTQQGPSVASIVAGGLLVLLAAVTSTWIISSPVLTWREVAGSVGCSLLAVLLTGQTVARYGERERARGRQERAQRAERAAPLPEPPVDHTEAAEHWATGGEDPARTEVLERIRVDLGVEDTQRLQHLGPSPAALRPLAVPVFRSEADRARWAHEHDIPTEFIPRQP